MTGAGTPEEAALRDLQAETLGRALISYINLVGLMAAYNLPREHLPLMLTLPGAVEHALAEHRAAVQDLAALLAVEDGAASWTALATAHKARYLTQAFEMVEAMPLPTLPHASTGP